MSLPSVSFVYGFNNIVTKRGLWVDLRFLSSCFGAFPWIQLGDYNVVRKASKRVYGF